MNQDQILSFIGTLLKTVGAGLVTKGVVSADLWSAVAGPEAVSFYVGLAMIAAPVVRDWFTHSDSGKLAAVEAIPSVKKIVVGPEATDGVAAAVADTLGRPKVVPTPPGDPQGRTI